MYKKMSKNEERKAKKSCIALLKDNYEICEVGNTNFVKKAEITRLFLKNGYKLNSGEVLEIIQEVFPDSKMTYTDGWSQEIKGIKKRKVVIL